MSWIVASLLNDRSRIKEESNLGSDEYDDLIAVEKAIDELKSHKLLSEYDLETLTLFYDDGYSKVRKLSKLERHTIAKRKAQVCDRIAYYLGGYFTDDGYLAYIKKKYKFPPEKMAVLEKYIKSKKKYQIIRKPINE